MNSDNKSKADFLADIYNNLTKADPSLSENVCKDSYKTPNEGMCFFSKLPPEEAASTLHSAISKSKLIPISILRQDFSIYTSNFRDSSKKLSIAMRAYTIEDASPDNDRKMFWPWKEKGYKTRMTIETFDN